MGNGTKNQEKTKSLWARVGMSIYLTDDEYKRIRALMDSDPLRAQNLLVELFKTRGIMNGESYIPQCDDFEFYA